MSQTYEELQDQDWVDKKETQKNQPDILSYFFTTLS
jgi:hypothetical protein